VVWHREGAFRIQWNGTSSLMPQARVLIVLRRAAEERVAGLASDLELVLALRAEVWAGRATESSSRAVQEVPDRTAPARMQEDQAEALRRMVCGP